MKFEAKEIILKNGQKCILRSPAPADAAEMIEMRIRTAGETDFLMNYPEELMDYPLENQIKFIENAVESENEFMLAAIVDGKLIGNCSVSFHTKIKTRHRASIGIAMLKEYWGLGIGSAFFEELIRAAQNHDGTTQLELEVAEGNHRAIRLYEKYGFETVGFRPDAFRLKDGTMLKEFFMIKKL